MTGDECSKDSWNCIVSFVVGLVQKKEGVQWCVALLLYCSQDNDFDSRFLKGQGKKIGCILLGFVDYRELKISFVM